MLVNTRALTQFPSPGSESFSASYRPRAFRGEFVSLASRNFGSPCVVPAPTSPPLLMCISFESIPGFSSEGVCPSTSFLDSASDREAVSKTRRCATSSTSSTICWRALSVGWTNASVTHHGLGSLLQLLQASPLYRWLSPSLSLRSKRP